ncbi:MAG: adenine-specific DNA methylase [Bacillota bacterium]
MDMNRKFCMPNKNTFSMKPLNKLFWKYKKNENSSKVIDPFARKCKLADITNDLDPAMNTDYNLEAYDFLKKFKSESVDMILFDPPFTPRQVSESYKKLGRTVNSEDTQYTYWRKLKDEITRILTTGGIVINCGYNSNGIGLKNGFKKEEILLLAHGVNHNDTIITVERKIQPNLF